MGENLVGCCLMQGGPIHTELAIRLLNQFPKLVNDVMLSEDYYGKLKARMLFVYQGWAKSNNKKRNAKLAQPCCI